MRLLRKRALIAKVGRSSSSIYRDIAAELLPPPISYGANICWPENEIDVVVAARIAGKGESEIRKLVRHLVATRAHALDIWQERSSDTKGAAELSA